ncbi:hypothetical protein LINPERPRIM_LOCUS5755 [Linum perenne]
MVGGDDSQKNLPDPVEMVVYHGGTMAGTDRGPEYMGGEAVEASIYRDFLCYFQLIKIATEELHYHAVERMWYVEPGLTPADGLHPIKTDKDAIAMGEAAAGGVVSLYMEAVVNPNTSLRQRQREARTAIDGVGVYQDTVTGNMYYRGAPIDDPPINREQVGTSQPSPPPATQPTQPE